MPRGIRLNQRNVVTGKKLTTQKVDLIKQKPIEPTLQLKRDKMAAFLRNIKNATLTEQDKALFKTFFKDVFRTEEDFKKMTPKTRTWYMMYFSDRFRMGEKELKREQNATYSSKKNHWMHIPIK